MAHSQLSPTAPNAPSPQRHHLPPPPRNHEMAIAPWLRGFSLLLLMTTGVKCGTMKAYAKDSALLQIHTHQRPRSGEAMAKDIVR